LAKSSAERRAEYNAFQFLRERGRLPITAAPTKKPRRRKGHSVEQVLDLRLKPPIPTEEEDLLAEMLTWRGIRFERQFCIRLARKWKKGIPTFAFADFWLPDAGLVVEVDGYQHRKRGQKRLDEIRTTRILNAMPQVGSVFRLWNSDVRKRSSRLDHLIRLAVAGRP